jgi:hypothetical protein
MSNLHSTHKKEEGRRLSSLRKNLLKIAGGDVPGGTLQQVRNQ